jgi:hypothetical protein
MGKNFRNKSHVPRSVLLFHFCSHPIRHIHGFKLDSLLILLNVIYTLNIFQSCISCSFHQQASHCVLNCIRFLNWINIKPCIILYCELRLFIEVLLNLIKQIRIIITWLSFKFLNKMYAALKIRFWFPGLFIVALPLDSI